MKKNFIACCGLLLFSPAAFSQTTTTNSTVNPNGVIVHESIGVEGIVVKSENQVSTRSLDDWNLAECIDAMRFLDLKLAESNDNDKERYQSAKILLQKRIDFLTITK